VAYKSQVCNIDFITFALWGPTTLNRLRKQEHRRKKSRCGSLFQMHRDSLKERQNTLKIKWGTLLHLDELH